jgi:hypothetical protein
VNQKIFVNKYSRIKEVMNECLPQESHITVLEQDCVLVDLPKESKRQQVIERCREQLDETDYTCVQSVTHVKVMNDRLEVSLPGIKRFLKKAKV